MSEPAVRVSGIVLASLMFQHANSDSDVEGLVLGESRFEEQVTISDSQSDRVHIQETYNVQKHVACRRLDTLYSGSGEVNMEVLQEMLADGGPAGHDGGRLAPPQDGVIGWYRQRRNSEQQMSFREKVVHENLRRALANPHMIFMLLTPSRAVLTGSTHRTEYAAFICRDRRFVNIPVLVNNLGLLEQQGYWRGAAPCSATGYIITMKKHRSKFFCSSGLLREVSEVNSMNESLQAELQKACGCVEESERQLEALQTEVSALRRRLEEKQPPEPVDAVQAEPRNNGALLSAVRALLGCSPMFLTQTLTLQAFPVPEEDASPETQVKEEQPPLPQLSDMTSRKRPRETAARERKRKRSR
ncbi:BRCA1-A complex subunit Abraxas 1 isoform X2 [Oryzias melastigma]|uniref:BRCA1-A complex subunit Abraxas 1 isoform X2 n=1 Tax=Oryzias melastigma TaxID=30732 RepID=UPI000CF821F5|nr:BRCA1-A complex subunit Abraxas 1 isoform X2 [Oryzias melastigma]